METVNETDNLITNDGSDAVFELDRVSKIYKNEGRILPHFAT